VDAEDVVHVLRNVHEALTPAGHVLDVHPTGADAPVRAGGVGLGFVDQREFRPIVAHSDTSVDALVADGLFDDVRRVEREIVEVYEDAEELFETADEWTNLRLRAPARRRVRAATPPFEVLWRVDFRLLRKRSARQRRPL